MEDQGPFLLLRTSCVRAASGHATAAPPSSVMNSRHLTRHSQIHSTPGRNPANWNAACSSEKALRYPITGIGRICDFRHERPYGRGTATKVTKSLRLIRPPPVGILPNRAFRFEDDKSKKARGPQTSRVIVHEGRRRKVDVCTHKSRSFRQLLAKIRIIRVRMLFSSTISFAKECASTTTQVSMIADKMPDLAIYFFSRRAALERQFENMSRSFAVLG